MCVSVFVCTYMQVWVDRVSQFLTCTVGLVRRQAGCNCPTSSPGHPGEPGVQAMLVDVRLKEATLYMYNELYVSTYVLCTVYVSMHHVLHVSMYPVHYVYVPCTVCVYVSVCQCEVVIG